MRPALSLCLCLFATVAPAQTLMTAEEFDSWSTGKTLDYSPVGTNGDAYSREQHFPNRRSLLQIDDTCAEGIWHAEGDAICFVYPAFEGLHCWHFWREGDQVLAKPTPSLPGSLPDVVTPSSSPLACPGPDVGV